jgi:hypothetical protein
VLPAFIRDRLERRPPVTAQHHSHRLPRLVRLFVADVTAAAITVPPAVARPIDSENVPASVESSPPVVQTIDEGFDWGSAAIGAGGGGALVVIVALGVAAHTTRRPVGVTR